MLCSIRTFPMYIFPNMSMQDLVRFAGISADKIFYALKFETISLGVDAMLRNMHLMCFGKRVTTEEVSWVMNSAGLRPPGVKTLAAMEITNRGKFPCKVASLDQTHLKNRGCACMMPVALREKALVVHPDDVWDPNVHFLAESADTPYCY